jgi:hypothetical protein
MGYTAGTCWSPWCKIYAGRPDRQRRGLAVIQILLWGVAGPTPWPRDFATVAGRSGFIGLAGVGLTLLTVLGVTWGPTHVSPAVVLNDRE